MYPSYREHGAPILVQILQNSMQLSRFCSGKDDLFRVRHSAALEAIVVKLLLYVCCYIRLSIKLPLERKTFTHADTFDLDRSSGYVRSEQRSSIDFANQ